MSQRDLPRSRPRSGKPVKIRDWEKQGQVISNWNDELCSGDSLPEVEIISLLEEQIPQYKLRADVLTKFGGYENQDWFIPSPALQVDEADLKLSPDQIRETLNYFLLCSNRVSQMTKTYDDIEAVTRLLEEKEKDLELTARIGKELLQANNKLENTVASLETDLKAAHEKITQLNHEVHKKTDLIQILTNDMDESTLESGSSGRINLELMQRRIASLKDENKSLKSEYCRLASCADDLEAQEEKLLKDFTGQLSCANSSMELLEDELDKVKEENKLQHEEMLTLQSKLQDTEEKLHKLLIENDELNGILAITKENQGSLAVELSEFKARYYEVEALLRDAQEQLRKLRKKQMPGARLSLFSSLGARGPGAFDSLQSELEMSMHSELSEDSGISNTEIPQFKKVFDTVRCASQNSLSSADSLGSLHSGIGGYVSSSSVYSGGSSGPRMSIRTQDNYTRGAYRRSSNSIYSSSSLGYPSLDSSGHSDNEFSQTDSEDSYPGAPQKGIPGVPGATELEAALQRLTPGAVLARRANLQHGSGFGGYESDTSLPFGCRTPDSLMSTGSGRNYYGNNWKLPEKLQIVKPMEGSQTLHHWSQLAQPTFSGLLDERPGVKIRGGKDLEDIGLQSYGLCDLEEDEEYTNPGKMFETSVHTFTYTNSMVMHPDDGTSVTSSAMASRVASACSSIQQSPAPTPRVLSRRNSCSTFSTTLGLAKMLNERGIKAVTPSAVNTPCGANSFTPTATPHNSPDISPSSSRRSSISGSPEPDDDIFSLPQLLLSSVPQFLMGSGKKKSSLTKGNRSSAKPEKQELLSLRRSSISGTPKPDDDIFNLPQLILSLVGSGKKKILLTNRNSSGAKPEKRVLVGGDKKKSSFTNGNRSGAKPEKQEFLVSGGKKKGSFAKGNRSGAKPEKPKSIVGKLEKIGIGNLMAGPGAISVSGGMYARPDLTSPMTQLTCLLPNHSGESSSSSSELKSKTETSSAPKSSFGVPARPGSGAVNRRLDQLNARKQRKQGVTRPDLGTVSTRQTPQRETEPQSQHSTLGTLSSLLFGRKGGLF